MILMVVVLLVVCIGLPLYYCWRLWRLDVPARAAWLLVSLEAASFVALVMLVGRWDMAGYYFRYLLIGMFLVALIRSGRRHRQRPWLDAAKAPPLRSLLRTQMGSSISLLLFAAVLVHVLAGLASQSGARPLAFPLQGGRFIVGQGGSVALLNQHVGHRAQHYAADIVALNAAGFRASGLLPRAVERYAIHGAQVVSPCAGNVTALRDDLPDLIPPSTDPANASGNHVVIACADLRVELAHLLRGSIVVSVGDELEVSDPVGRVGNSGNTTEPHLHIHASNPATGTAVPITFDGRAPLRNRIYQR